VKPAVLSGTLITGSPPVVTKTLFRTVTSVAAPSK
jgi:hypothetical protein